MTAVRLSVNSNGECKKAKRKTEKTRKQLWINNSLSFTFPFDLKGKRWLLEKQKAYVVIFRFKWVLFLFICFFFFLVIDMSCRKFNAMFKDHVTFLVEIHCNAKPIDLLGKLWFCHWLMIFQCNGHAGIGNLIVHQCNIKTNQLVESECVIQLVFAVRLNQNLSNIRIYVVRKCNSNDNTNQDLFVQCTMYVCCVLRSTRTC